MAPRPPPRELVDAEVRRLLEECCAEARDTLVQHRDRLERLTRALLEAGTLDAESAYAAAGVHGPGGTASPGSQPFEDQ